jgi:L-rhamnose mutarotase
MKKAFKMHLFPGEAGEYQRRHDEIWSELSDLLKETGISDYSIFLDEESNTLFGVMNVTDVEKLNELPNHPVMQRWWIYMSDLMQTNADHSPVVKDLKKVFYLP